MRSTFLKHLLGCFLEFASSIETAFRGLHSLPLHLATGWLLVNDHALDLVTFALLLVLTILDK